MIDDLPRHAMHLSNPHVGVGMSDQSGQHQAQVVDDRGIGQSVVAASQADSTVHVLHSVRLARRYRGRSCPVPSGGRWHCPSRHLVPSREKAHCRRLVTVREREVSGMLSEKQERLIRIFAETKRMRVRKPSRSDLQSIPTREDRRSAIEHEAMREQSDLERLAQLDDGHQGASSAEH
jgi:hypothetical protein